MTAGHSSRPATNNEYNSDPQYQNLPTAQNKANTTLQKPISAATNSRKIIMSGGQAQPHGQTQPLNKLEKIIQSRKEPAGDQYVVHDDKNEKDKKTDGNIETHPLDRAQMYKNEGGGEPVESIEFCT